MELEQWIEKYNKKTKEIFKIKPFASLMFYHNKGFMQFAIIDDFRGEKVLMIYETCGDGRYFEQEALKIAKENGCTKLITTIYRDPHVYQKRFPKTKVYAYVMSEEVV